MRVRDAAWRCVDMVQVRGKRLESGDLERLAIAWRERLEGVGPRLIVNDRLDVALGAGADGVHLGSDDLPVERARVLAPEGFVIGASARNRATLLAAQASGADYAGLGSFFSTDTKDDAVRLDPDAAGLAEAIPGLEIPVLAIGGVRAEHVREVFSIPAVTGVAVSGAVQRAMDPGAAIHTIRKTLDAVWSEREEGA